MWDLQTGREVHNLLPWPANDRAWGLAFSPDSTFLAAVGGAQFHRGEGLKGFVIVWNLRTGKEQGFGAGLNARVRSVAFSADGRMLATGGDDGAVRLWEVATRQERYRFTGHESIVHSVAFSPDGTFVAATSVDAPVFVWDVTGCYHRQPSPTAFSPVEEDRLWKSLADTDAAGAFNAMRQLLSRPAPAMLVAGRVKPVALIEAKVIEQHLSTIDSDDFSARQKASTELAKVGEQAEPLLRKALENAPSAEAKRQIEALLDGMATLSPEQLARTPGTRNAGVRGYCRGKETAWQVGRRCEERPPDTSGQGSNGADEEAGILCRQNAANATLFRINRRLQDMKRFLPAWRSDLFRVPNADVL